MGIATIAVMLVPLAAGGSSATAGTAAVTDSSASAPAALADATQVPTLPASAIPQPRLRAVPLRGVDGSVMRVAPEPTEHDHDEESQGSDRTESSVGQSQAQAPAVAPEDLETAAAATVTSEAQPADLVAVSADKPFASGTSIQVRVLQEDGWTEWESLAAEDGHGPDPGSAEARGIRIGSEPLMTGDATKIQVRVDTPDGQLPAGTRLDLVSAPTSAPDAESAAQAAPASMSTPASVSPASVSPASGSLATASAVSVAQSTAAGVAIPRPAIYTRAQWGANESWRNREPYYTGDIRAGFLHHTASTSNYSREQTPAQIRAIYAYHTRSLGHSDIDYNFIVDRFGRLWEGRYGGMDRPVLGGHTAGFNENTFAVVALGNFQTTAPSSANLAKIKDSVARLFAWKLGLYGVNPVSTAHLLSVGYTKPTRFPKGTVAAIPAISSHQMVNYTSCPGTYLQKQLPAIRTLAAKYAHVVIKPPVSQPSSVRYGASSVTVKATTDRAVTWRADIFSPCSTKPVRSYTGKRSTAGSIGFTWDRRNTAGTLQLPAIYTVHISGTAVDGSRVLPVTGSVTITPAPGGSWGPCANVARVVGPSASATSVVWGRTFAPRSRTVVLTAPATESARALAAGVVAGPLAQYLRAPLLLTSRSGLHASVAADLRARKATEVLVVGGTDVVPAAIVKAVAKLGASVTRLGGGTTDATAVAVAQRFPATTPAVLVSPSLAPAHALSGSALAATRGEPVLLAGTTSIPTITRKALATRPSVTVAIPSDLSDAKIKAGLAARATWQRLEGVDEVDASAVIGAAAPKGVEQVVLLPALTTTWATASLAASVGTPLLFTGSSTLPTQTGSLLGSRAALRTSLTPVSRTVLEDSVLGAASQLLAGDPWAPTRPVTYQFTGLDATPEPLKKGAALSVAARIKVSYDAGAWRDAPVGTSVTVEHRPDTATSYRKVTTVRLTKAGVLKAPVVASTTGRWRIMVGKTASPNDHVVVRP